MLEEGPGVAFAQHGEERHTRNRLGYDTASRDENRFLDAIVWLIQSQLLSSLLGNRCPSLLALELPCARNSQIYPVSS